MLPPEGYHKVKERQVCHLKISLYGLKQASRQWNTEWTKHLHNFGFVQSKADTCLFIYNSAKSSIMLLVYVDDLLISGISDDLIHELKKSLHTSFTIKDLGQEKIFLGLEIDRSPLGICVSRKKYIYDIISDTGMLQAKVVHSPLPPELQLQEDEGELLEDASQYRRLTGRLLYLNFTRPDLMFAVHHLSQYVHQPCKPHWLVALHVVRYLKSTSTTGLFCLLQLLSN